MEPIDLVCASPQMKHIAETVRMSRGRTLLLTGETGVGKDVLARWAHTISPVAEGPFVAINCAAIQDSLWESEIFGHAKGAFTGAVSDKPGHIEQAEKGTLFLNEIGDMPLPTQAKLLTFLDTQEFQRVGETKTRSVNTRIIAATNHDLEQAIEAGKFRQDLFYRLAVVHADIPPLRERPEDVLVLAEFHLQEVVRQRGTETVRLTDPTREMLIRQPWKGNVRELQSALEMAFERCVEAGQNTLVPEHFAPELHDLSSPVGKKRRDPEHPLQRTATLGETTPERAPQKAAERWSRAPQLLLPRMPVFGDLEALKDFLDQFKTPSGRWNISAAHQVLIDSGRIKIGRRAFAKKVKQLFPDA